MALDPPDRTTPERSASDRPASERFAVTGLTFDDVLLVPAASDVRVIGPAWILTTSY